MSLFSGAPVDEVIVVEQDDLTPDDLLATCEAFLYCIGWADDGGAVAALMASERVAAAQGCDVGTHLMPHYTSSPSIGTGSSSSTVASAAATHAAD